MELGGFFEYMTFGSIFKVHYAKKICSENKKTKRINQCHEITNVLQLWKKKNSLQLLTKQRLQKFYYLEVIGPNDYGWIDPGLFSCIVN